MNPRLLLLTTSVQASYCQASLEELTFAVYPAVQRQSRVGSPCLTESVIRSAQQDGTVQAADLPLTRPEYSNNAEREITNE
jgi:hypothetical protein